MQCLLKVAAHPGNEIRVTSVWNSPIGGKRTAEADPPTLTVARNSSPPQDSLNSVQKSNIEFCDRKPGYGSLPRSSAFGNYARTRVQRAGACLDPYVADESLIFMTMTLPGGTMSAFAALASWSSWLIHELKKWLFKRHKSALSLYVWEYQKRGALHLHYAMVCKDESARKFIADNLRRWWHDALVRVSERSGVDLFERENGESWKGHYQTIQTDCQVVKKSVARYLSKYLSKAAKGWETKSLPCPVRWFGVSRHLSQLVKQQTVEVVNRYSDVAKWRARVEQVNSCLASAEGLSWSYTDKSGNASVQVVYPSSPGEYQSLINELESVMDIDNRSGVNMHRNRAELRAYWHMLRTAIRGFEGYAERTNKSRYEWLKAQSTSDAIRSVDFIVASRWLMTLLAGYHSNRVPDSVYAADARLSEYLAKVVAIAGNPADHWQHVSPQLRSMTVHSTPAHRALILPQWRDK